MNNLCNNCIHKDVCSRWTATWGMKTCEHFREATKKGKWEYAGKSNGHAICRCSVCKTLVRGRGHFCKECGADMRQKGGTDV